MFDAHPGCGIFPRPQVAGLIAFWLNFLGACAIAIVLIALGAHFKVRFCLCPGFCFRGDSIIGGAHPVASTSFVWASGLRDRLGILVLLYLVLGCGLMVQVGHLLLLGCLKVLRLSRLKCALCLVVLILVEACSLFPF